MSGRYYSRRIGGKLIQTSYFKFDEITGDAIDSGSNELNGTLNGSITRDGTFYDFSASQDSYVELPINDFVDFREGVVLKDFVFKANVVFLGNKTSRIIGKRIVSGLTTEDWDLVYSNNGFLRFEIFGPTQSLQADFTPVLNQEYVIGVTYYNNVFKLFVDGVVIGTLNDGGTQYDDRGNSANIQIGAISRYNNQNINGKERFVFIQKGAGWTDQEILNNYNNNGIVTL